MGFWGPKMTSCIQWTYDNGMPRNVSPAMFARWMDEKLGTKHFGSDHPETCAALWLDALNK